MRKGPSKSLLVGAGLGMVALLLVGGVLVIGGEPAPPEGTLASLDTPATAEVPPPGPPSATPSTEGAASIEEETEEADPSTEAVGGAERPDPSTSPGWVRAVATTFVNIRSAPGSESEVQGVVPRDSEVLLGSSANGEWREVRSGELTGWAWEPLFTLPTEGP